MQQQEKLAELQAKHAMLQQKECAIDAELDAEKAIAEHIRSAAPLIIDGTNASQTKAREALQAAVNELKSYYWFSNFGLWFFDDESLCLG